MAQNNRITFNYGHMEDKNYSIEKSVYNVYICNTKLRCKMEDRLIKLEEKLSTFINAVQSAFEKIDKNFESFNKRFDVINVKLNTLHEKIDLLQGNSSSTIETLETGFNDIKTEIEKISIVTRYENDLPYLIK